MLGLPLLFDVGWFGLSMRSTLRPQSCKFIIAQ
jgi:hypothetical protein